MLSRLEYRRIPIAYPHIFKGHRAGPRTCFALSPPSTASSPPRRGWKPRFEHLFDSPLSNERESKKEKIVKLNHFQIFRILRRMKRLLSRFVAIVKNKLAIRSWPREEAEIRRDERGSFRFDVSRSIFLFSFFPSSVSGAGILSPWKASTSIRKGDSFVVPSRISCIPARTPREASLKPKVIPGEADAADVKRRAERLGGSSRTLSRVTRLHTSGRKHVEGRWEIKRRG